MKILKEVEEIFNQAEKLKWAMLLPAKEGLMLTAGIDELRGSDYPDYVLEAEVGDCGICENRGVAYFPHGEDDYFDEPCECVWGNMKIYESPRSGLN